MKDLAIYVNQDGMYNTLEIVISDIPIENIKDWHKITIDKSVVNFKDLLWKLRKYFMTNSDDKANIIRLIDSKIPDEIIITKDVIEELNANKMI